MRYGFGALDVHADRLRLRLEAPRRRLRHAGVHAPGPHLLPAPDQAVLDPGQPVGQLDPRREFAAQSNIELVPLPTYASYLNRIQAYFRPIIEFVVNNADYLDWDAFAHALAVHVLHRNGCARDRRIAERERRLMITA